MKFFKLFQAELPKALKAVVFTIPLLWFVPFITEGLQHFVEYHLDMFNEGDGIDAGKETIIRLVFGFVKVVSLMITAILTIKLGFSGWPKGKYFLYIGQELKIIILICVTMLCLMLTVHFFGHSLIMFTLRYIEMPEALQPYIPILILLLFSMLFRVQMIKLYIKIAKRKVEETGFIKNSYLFELYQVVFFTAFVLPLLPLHISLNNYAVGQSDFLLVGLLLLDSLLVGAIAIGIGVTLYMALYLSFYIEKNNNAPI